MIAQWKQVCWGATLAVLLGPHADIHSDSHASGCLGRLVRYCQTDGSPATITAATYYSIGVRNDSSRQIRTLDLGCVSPTGSSGVIFRSTVTKTLDPGESFFQFSSDAPNSYVAECDKREAKIAVVGVEFADGTSWAHRP